MDQTFLADGNFYLHRAYSIAGKIDTKDAVARLFVSMVCKDALATRCNKILVGFDGCDIFRYKVYKKYKANRSDDGKGTQSDRLIYTQSLPHLQKILTQIGIPHIQVDDLEADDILASTCQQPGLYVIGTRDKDSYQLLNDRVKIYVSVGDPHYITEKEVRKKFGLHPSKMVMYQTLIGDKIDNIPAIKGLKESLVRAACAKYATIGDWYKDADEGTRKILRINKDRITRNRKLVMLVRDRPCKVGTIAKDAYTKWNKSPNSLSMYAQFVNPKTKKLF